MIRIRVRSPGWLGCLFGVVLAVALGVGLPAAVMLNTPQGGLFVQQLLSGQIQEALGMFTTLGAVAVGKSGCLGLSSHFLALDAAQNKLIYQWP